MAKQLTSDELRRITERALGGYSNAADPALIDDGIEEGINEVWTILKNARADYFVTSSQNTDATADNYFPLLSTTAREYDLPVDFAELKLIEIQDSGYESTEFVYRDMSSQEFKDARRDETANPSRNVGTYLYDIVGKRTFILAQFPRYAFDATIWYVRQMPDSMSALVIDEIFYPYARRIAIYAAQYITCTLQDTELSEAWRRRWKDSVISIAQGASPRQIQDAVFVEDFIG
jgi:hypothetical protein